MGQGSGPSHRLAPAERLELLRLVRAGRATEGARAQRTPCTPRVRRSRFQGPVGGIVVTSRIRSRARRRN